MDERIEQGTLRFHNRKRYGEVEVWKNQRTNKWYARVRGSNGKILMSSEADGYSSRNTALNALDSACQTIASCYL